MKSKILTCLLSILPLISFSQNNYTSDGTFVAGGELGYASQSSSSSNSGSVSTFSSNLYFGVMVAKGFELGFRPGFTINSGSGSTLKVIDLYFNPNYNFTTTSNVYPYLGFIIGYNSLGYNGTEYSGMTVGGEGGLKCLLGTNSLVLIKIEYIGQTYNDAGSSSFGSSDDLTINTVSFGVGFRCFIPRITKVK